MLRASSAGRLATGLPLAGFRILRVGIFFVGRLRRGKAWEPQMNADEHRWTGKDLASEKWWVGRT
jgi:hypothetical protein